MFSDALRRGFGLTALLALFSFPAWAQSETEETSTATMLASGWSVQCNNTDSGLNCAASINVSVNGQAQRLFVLTFRQNPDGEGLRLIMQLPFGLNLPRGVDLRADESFAENFAIDTCLQSGCFVFEPAEDDLIETMKEGEELLVTMQTANGGDTVITLPLTGFTAAIEKLQ